MPMGRKRKAYQKIPTSTESFGYAIRLARVQKGWSMAEAAAKARVTAIRLQRIENQIVQASEKEAGKLNALFEIEFIQHTQASNS
jgi:ribosome-binding protein aMBF1 (putative translation factor)